MKIAIVGTVGIPAKYGGFETLVEYLTRELGGYYKFSVYCSSKAYTEKLDNHNNASLVYLPFNANGAQSIIYDILSMIHAAKSKSDVMLILGVSGCFFLPLLKLFYHKPIIVNIDGLEWKREKWSQKVKIFLKFSEKMAVNYGDHVVTDNKVIQDYVMSEYGKSSTLIAYGADHVKKVEVTSESRQKYTFLNGRYAFKVCRIEPENNVHMILEAFAEITTMSLVIVGNWQNSEYGRTLKEQYSVYPHIYLINPIYDQNILNQLRSNCTIYVHGHSAGGTNPSLVEAMHLGLAIVAFGVTYNRETTDNCALYFNNSNELKQIVEIISDKEILILGLSMYTFAKEHYSWKMIASKYAKLFEYKGK
ncbi:DUF1972 domain-containing protein [Sulfuricurvum sp.]|uniref:DUF1972 domain-containing protein n=1 Tax=Sulfuricurvum sp. TaxID=2025608 RepID=UPI00262DA45B|nr:DUF1972 domain-containing protein [Sulfuricurvum sp.]MDD4950734.1 DUF1972 domain-containing protein [Sulfuricurvum sp.]